MVSTPPAVRAPAGFMPTCAVAFGAIDGPATPVDPAHPLPVAITTAASASAPLAGSTAASLVAGPFTPDLGRPVWLTLSGSWTGTVQLLRSIDGGVTRLPLTFGDGSPRGSFAGNVQAPIVEESAAGASYYLAITITGGTLAYRVAQ